MKFGLKQARESMGYTQLELMILTGIDRTRLSLLENGFYLPKLREIEKLAKALSVNPEDLLFDLKKPTDIVRPDPVLECSK